MVGTPSPSLGARLREARQRAGLSQEELARRSGLSVRALRDIEQDRVRQPHPASLERLLTVLDLPESEHDHLRTAARGRGAGQPGGPDPASRLLVELLGPLRVRRGETVIELRGTVSRAVLALTALRLGRPVPRDEIIDALWGDAPPVSCVAQLHAAVTKVRAALDPERERRAPTGPLRLEAAGYALHLDHAQVDLHRFSVQLAGARTLADAGSAEAAVVALERGLAQWRGRVLSGEPDGVRDQAAALAAAGQRVEAVLLVADLALQLGRPTTAVSYLRPMTAEEPFHEGLHARLVLALAAQGEQAAALEAFQAIRRRLVEELGVEPGPELRQAQRRVLRGEATGSDVTAVSGAQQMPPPRPAVAGQTPWTTPRLLPADLPDFTARRREIAELERLLAGDDPRSPSPVAGVAGMGGVGKTALAIRIAHRLAASHPDGQLYVNLRGGPHDAPLDPGDVLARFLRATGVDGPAIPQDPVSRADLYRSRTAGRRVLVVLDNAASAAQVRALLPGGNRSSVVVCGRARLAALEGARWIDLDVLPPDGALQLLRRVTGRERVDADAPGAAEIVRLCGYLPLAVRIAGAKLAARPGWSLGWFAGVLRHERRRLDQLSVGDLEVRASLELSYRELGAAAARAFRLLGCLDAPDFPARIAAAVLDVPAEDGAEPLAELVGANLLVETGPDATGQLRYRFHDLVRLYARERAAGEDAAHELRGAYSRAAGAWLVLAERFARAVPGPCYATLHGPALRPSLGDEADFDDLDPLTWFDAEQAALRAQIRQACAEGLDQVAFDLAGCLEKYFDLRGMYEEWRVTNEAVMALCRERGNLLGEAVMRRGLLDVRTWNTVPEPGDVGADGGAMGRSLADARWLLESFTRLGERRGMADAAVACVWGLCAAGDYPGALLLARRGLDLALDSGHLGGIARSHVALALVKSFVEDGASSIEHLELALVSARQLGNPRYEAGVLQFLGIGHRELGQFGDAERRLRESLAISRRWNDRYTEVLTLLALGRLHLETGDPRARDEAELSLALGREYTMPHHVAEALAVLGSIALADGDGQLARDLLTESVQLWRTRGWPLFLVSALAACAEACDAVGDQQAGARYRAEAAGLSAALGAVTGPAASTLVLAERIEGDRS